jgi:hypothetical protein
MFIAFSFQSANYTILLGFFFKSERQILDMFNNRVDSKENR